MLAAVLTAIATPLERAHWLPALVATGQQRLSASKADDKLSKWADADKLSKMFEHGYPSLHVAQAGVVVHCFDDTENFWDPWKPCENDHCPQRGPWWSTSVINKKQRNTFGNSGLILSPSYTKVLCAATSDVGTESAGCKMGSVINGAHALRKMLETSMRGVQPYNELIVDSDHYLNNLPDSVAAVVYNLRGAGDQSKAVRTYVRMLDNYKLTESQVPLLRANFAPAGPGSDPTNKTLPAFTDVSVDARRMLEENNWTEESTHELRKRRRRLQKLVKSERRKQRDVLEKLEQPELRWP